MVSIVDTFTSLETPYKLITIATFLTTLVALILLPMSFHEATTKSYMGEFFGESKIVRNWHFYLGAVSTIYSALFFATIAQMGPSRGIALPSAPDLPNDALMAAEARAIAAEAALQALQAEQADLIREAERRGVARGLCQYSWNANSDLR